MILDEPLRHDELEAIAVHVVDVIARRGSFHLRKSSAVFRARKAQ